MDEKPGSEATVRPGSEATGNSGSEATNESELDLAAATLARLKRSAGNTTQGKQSKKKSSRSQDAANTPGSGSDERDPKLLGDAVNRLIDERGWASDAAGGDLVANWVQIVGADLADHVAIERIEGTTLVLRAESTTWMNAAKLYESTLQDAIDSAVGVGVITELKILGPSGPSWVKGKRTVKGRGPRDTYG